MKIAKTNIRVYQIVCFSWFFGFLLSACSDAVTAKLADIELHDFLGPRPGTTYTYVVSDGTGPSWNLKVAGLSCASEVRCRVRETADFGPREVFKPGETPTSEYELAIEGGSIIRKAHNTESILLKSPLKPNPDTWEVKYWVSGNSGVPSVAHCGIAKISEGEFKRVKHTVIHVECMQKLEEIVIHRRFSFASGIGLMSLVEESETLGGKPIKGTVRTELIDIKR